MTNNLENSGAPPRRTTSENPNEPASMPAKLSTAKRSDVLYMGIKTSILAINTRTGQPIWQTDLKQMGFISLQLDGDALYVGTNGEIFCLDRATGQVLWHNELKGFGRGLVTFASYSPTLEAVCIAAQQQASSA